MHKAILSFLLLGILVSCQKKPDSYESEILKVEKLTESLYLHVSYIEYQGNMVGCNGLIYIKDNQAIIADTPNDSLASEELISFLQNELKVDIKGVVATHFHSDCLGGFGAFQRNDIPTYASSMTQLLSKNDGNPQADHLFENHINLLDGSIQFKYFGPGHTEDNIIAYIPTENLIFGGCLVKPLDASKGYLGDSNIGEWPNTIKIIRDEYPDIQHVIPGHGKSGNAELLDYTIQLFTE